MGTPLKRASSSPVRRAAPERIASALRLGADDPPCAVQTEWETDGAIAAVSTTYLPAHLAGLLMPRLDATDDPAAALNPVAAQQGSLSLARPAALYMEVRQPPRWAARTLHLSSADPAIIITARLDDPAIRVPVALTVAILHPGHFRIAIETPDVHGRKCPAPPSWTGPGAIANL
jgi:DNA-binding GntR family transcriptional regulator